MIEDAVEDAQTAELDFQLCREVTSALLSELGLFRVRVWDHEGAVRAGSAATTNWTDRVDNFAWHWLVRDAGELVGAGRLSFHADAADLPDAHLFGDVLNSLRGSAAAPLASINRLVVAPTHRHRCIARRLITERIAAAQAAGSVAVLTSASVSIVPEFVSRGFRTLAQRPGKNFPELQWTMMVLDLSPNVRQRCAEPR